MNSTRKISNMHPSPLSRVTIKGVRDYNEFLNHEISNACLKGNNATALMHYNCLEWKPTNVSERIEEKETLSPCSRPLAVNVLIHLYRDICSKRKALSPAIKEKNIRKVFSLIAPFRQCQARVGAPASCTEVTAAH